MKKFAAAVGVTGVMGVGMFATAPSASAHATYIPHGSDRAYVSSTHRTVSVFDRECDGNTVRAYVRLSNGVVYPLADTNGCQANGRAATFSLNIVSYRLCEASVSCTSWRLP